MTIHANKLISLIQEEENISLERILIFTLNFLSLSDTIESESLFVHVVMHKQCTTKIQYGFNRIKSYDVDCDTYIKICRYISDLLKLNSIEFNGLYYK